MSWSVSWTGRASDALPEHMPVRGVTGYVYRVAQDAVWESLQAIASSNPDAYARVVANGWERPGDPPKGEFSLTIGIIESHSELDSQLKSQQPIDLLSSQGDISSSSGGPAS